MTIVSSAARRGFTLIELLVVIAIIGILSSVVLASLNTARNKGADAAIKSNLEQARTQGELFYDANGNNYLTGAAGGTGDLCSSTGLVNGVSGVYKSVFAAAQADGLGAVTPNAIGTGANAVCNSSAGAWAAQVPLKATANTWFCVDNTGTATTTNASVLTATNDYLCS